MAHRQLGEENRAQTALSKACINGALLPAARDALADPQLQLVVTDADTIDSSDSDILPHTPADPDRLAELGEELGIGASLGRLSKALGWPGS